MKNIDEDNCLTTLTQCWIKVYTQINFILIQLFKSGSQAGLDELITALNELGEKYGYTTKSYNLLAIILVLKDDIDRALKIFESALNDLKLETTEGAEAHLY